MDRLTSVTRLVNLALLWVGGICLGGMILITCANIFLRQFLGPIPGAVELMGYAGALATAFALGFSQTSKSHIAVDVLVTAYGKSLKRVMALINQGVCSVFFGLAAWHIVEKALVLKATGEISETLRIIYYPVILAVALGFFSLALTLVTGFLQTLTDHKEGSR
jgi:TRAP-type C4-dicarboxylate transport system permease small subunit